MPTIHEIMSAAIQHHQAGRLDIAEQAYRQILAVAPNQPDALHLLGVVAHQRGKGQVAADSIRRAVALNPNMADYHSNLGAVYLALGKAEEAEASCRRAVELNPDLADAHNNLGAALKEQGKLEPAVASYRRAVKIKSEYAEAHKNLGNALNALKKNDEAVACYRRALQIKPDYAEAHANLGNALTKLGKLDEAVACCRRALQIDPNHAEAHNVLGMALKDRGNVQQAVASYRRALQIKPDDAPALNNLGNALKALGKMDEAAASYRRAAQVQPDYLFAHSNLGKLLEEQGQLDEAADSFQKAHQIEPDQPLWELWIATLWPTVFSSNREMDEYRRKLVLDSERFADVDFQFDLARTSASIPEPPLNLQFDKGNIRPVKEAYARIFRGRFPQETPAPRTGLPRIGFVVTRGHERSFLKSLGGVLQRIRHNLLEPVIVCSAAAAAGVRAAVGDTVRILTIPEAFDRMLETIRAARFDLLYYWEVGTDATNYFLPFFRLAPVQCTSWGIQMTSGIPTVDYYLSSELVEPEDAAEHYSETLVPARTLLTYQERLSPPDPRNARDGFGFAAGQHVYLCAQHLGKFHPDFDPVLAAILRQDPAGVIVATEGRHGHGAPKLQSRFAETIPEVADRIVFLPRQAQPDYLRLVAAADVLLDPPYFGGVNTTYDGFSLGKAIVTVPSEFHRGRYTFGCYQKMGVTDCVASDLDHYVEIAVALGTDAEHRAAVERRIQAAVDALFEDIEAVREHERIFQELVERARTP